MMSAIALRAKYLDEAARVLAPLPTSDRADLLRELESHLVDSVESMAPDGDEETRLRAAIERLGEPRIYLRPIVADHLLLAGTTTYRPLVLARGLYQNTFGGARAAALSVGFGLAYTLIAIFAAMALLKAFVPSHVGNFIYPDGSRAFGIVANTANARETLGWSVVPVTLSGAALLYAGVTRVLAALHRRATASAARPTPGPISLR